ncbi:TetR family transcriptional regulator [Cryptosporangium sp. NPDC048952]|uniref:TetR family transcriptional regulator n=1 Tax=Cryptosporangium sp. NPDC048952 TaxID=3363961 RepID=UPI0037247615
MTDEPALALRQRANREEVLDAAAEAFIERGYAATSIDDVADQLGGTKGRVYHYFRTKGDLFLGVHRRALDMAIAAVTPLFDADTSATTKLHDMAEAHARLMMEESSYMRLAVQHAEMALAVEGRTPRRALLEVLALRNEYESLFETVIAEGIQLGEFRQVDAGLMAKAALGSLNWISVWYRPAGRGKTQPQAPEIAAEFAQFVVAGLVNPKRATRERKR